MTSSRHDVLFEGEGQETGLFSIYRSWLWGCSSQDLCQVFSTRERWSFLRSEAGVSGKRIEFSAACTTAS